MPTPAAQINESGRAFPSLARPDRYFPATCIEDARQRVEACVRRGDGPAVVIGGSGLGKTMLAEVLTEGLAQRFRIVRLAGSQLCTRRAMLQAILFELDLPFRDNTEGELRITLRSSLTDVASNPHGVAMIVDEAENLSPKLLEEIRGLSNLARRGEPLVRPVLLGGSGLEDLLATLQLETFSQRLAARCYLSPLSYEETREFARAHIAAVGGDPGEVFSSDGLDALFHASDGVPRLISQVSDRALQTAVIESLPIIDAKVVQTAWSDIHQLPAPWHTPEPSRPTQQPAASVVEFGGLDDDQEDIPLAPVEEPTQQGAVWNADQALDQLTLSPEQPATPSLEAEDSSSLDDPFGSDFAEEEVVIDRFADLQSAFGPTTPLVSNTDDPTLSLMASTYENIELEDEEEAVDPTELDEDQEEPYDLEPAAEIPQLRLQSGEGSEAPELDDLLGNQAETPAVDYSTGNPDHDERGTDDHGPDERDSDQRDILVIENDLAEIETTIRPTAERREYRQLFAQLRRG